jgi:hypothetical protein
MKIKNLELSILRTKLGQEVTPLTGRSTRCPSSFSSRFPPMKGSTDTTSAVSRVEGTNMRGFILVTPTVSTGFDVKRAFRSVRSRTVARRHLETASELQFPGGAKGIRTPPSAAEILLDLQFRCVSFRFSPARYLRLRSRVLTASRRRTTGVAVEKPRQPCGLVRTEGDLLNDTDAAAVTHLGDNEVLQVNGGKVGRIEVVETY